MLKIVLISCLLFVSAGCQKKASHPLNEWMSKSDKIKVLSTIAQIGDLVKEVGGERVDNWTLIQGALDPHAYELVKGDGEKLERADLIFYNGLGLEHGASLSSWLHSSIKAHAVSEEILKRAPEKIIYKGKAIDPHVWMDISLWEYSVDSITAELSKKDPEGAPYYHLRAAVLKDRMEKVHRELYEYTHQISSERRYLVTSHDAFHYFTRAYLSESQAELNWEERVSAPEGLAPDGQISSSDIQNMLQVIRTHRINVLFPESNVSRDSIRKIVLSGKELGISLGICEEPLYGDAMEGEDLSYLDMMRHNVDVVVNNLKKYERD